MKGLILQNPYRVLGLLANANIRAIQSKANKLKKLIYAQEQFLGDEYTFPSLGYLERSIDTIENAVNKLTLDKDRVFYAIFWFYAGDRITDEPAFSSLKFSDKKEAMDIWTKRTWNKKITETTASAWNNFSTLLLLNDDKYAVQNAINLKFQLFESSEYCEFVYSIVDRTFKISAENLQRIFWEEIQEITVLPSIISKVQIPTFLIDETRNKLLSKIKESIKTARNQSKEDVDTNAVSLAKKLYYSATNTLDKLKMLGINEKYEIIENDVAEEILNCAILYFNFWSKVMIESDEVVNTLSLIELSLKLCNNGILKSKIEATVKNIKPYLKRILDDLQLELKNTENDMQNKKNAYEKQIEAILYSYQKYNPIKKALSKILKNRFFKSTKWIRSLTDCNFIKRQQYEKDNEKKIADIKQEIAVLYHQFNDVQRTINEKIALIKQFLYEK
jgi:hypothetical protein